MQAWCQLGESQKEQWQEEINRKDKQKQKKAAHGSLAECGQPSRLDLQEQKYSKGQMGEDQSSQWTLELQDMSCLTACSFV